LIFGAMSNAVTSADLASPPDPPQDRSGQSVPPNTAYLLDVVHVLLAYARHLSLTLDSRAARWGFSVFAQFFGTARLPVIRARLARGILRIMALQRVLLSRARRGRDTDFSGPRERTPPTPKPPLPEADSNTEPAPPPVRPKRVRRCYADTTPDLDTLPTLAQLEAEIRRREIGATLSDICRYLGLAPELCESRFLLALQLTIRWCRGNLYKLVMDFRRRQADFEPELKPAPPLCVPERSRAGIQRMLGFFIGERWPVMPDPYDAPPGMLVLPATGPP
jgi:hypothetical protein